MNQYRTTQGDEGESRRDPAEIRAEINETRSVIAGDIRELGEKFSPDNLKASARHVIHEAREEAKDAVREAKDAAMDKLITAKDHAMDSLSETASEVGYRARRASAATAGFVSANAVPLSLIGLGAGWLMLTMRRQRRLREPGPYTIGHDDRSHDRYERVQQTVSSLGERAHELGYRAQELGHDARDRVVSAGRRTNELAHENPLAFGALAIAAGVGIGLALPSSQAENRLMGPARGRLADQARSYVGEARNAAEQTAQKAMQAVDEVKQSMTQPSAPR